MVQYKNVHDRNIILMYKGALTFDLLSSIIGTAEQRINELESDRRLKKKFYSVLTESIQNLHYHVEKAEIDDETISLCEANSVLILLSAKKRYYSLITCNNIENSHVAALQTKIDEINAMDRDELRAVYRDSLSNNEFSSKNTAGLGLMDIARKTETKFKYNFERINDNYSYFSLEVHLPRNAQKRTNRAGVLEKNDLVGSLA